MTNDKKNFVNTKYYYVNEIVLFLAIKLQVELNTKAFQACILE